MLHEVWAEKSVLWLANPTHEREGQSALSKPDGSTREARLAGI
jgi:hypothetical protein